MATIGELTDVPQPGAQVASAWAQEVTHRIVHRFATEAALAGWTSAADGSVAYVAATLAHYVRRGGAWKPLVVGDLARTAWTPKLPTGWTGGAITGMYQRIGSLCWVEYNHTGITPVGGAAQMWSVKLPFACVAETWLQAGIVGYSNGQIVIPVARFLGNDLGLFPTATVFDGIDNAGYFDGHPIAGTPASVRVNAWYPIDPASAFIPVPP